MKILLKWSLLLSSFLWLSCDPPAKEDSSTTVEHETTASLDYTFKTYSTEYGACEADTSAYCTRINLSYPQFTDNSRFNTAPINNRIKAYVLNQFSSDSTDNKTVEAFAEQFIDDYKEIKAAFGEAVGWYARINGQVVRKDTSIVAVELTAEMYTGGAHGSYHLQYLNFNPKTGNKITLTSIFEPGYEEKLNKTVERKFRETHGIAPDRDLSDEGYQFEEGKYYNDNNFALLEEGVKFYYNSYEIAPYSKGPSEVMVPYKELKGVLRENQPGIRFKEAL